MSSKVPPTPNPMRFGKARDRAFMKRRSLQVDLEAEEVPKTPEFSQPPLPEASTSATTTGALPKPNFNNRPQRRSAPAAPAAPPSVVRSTRNRRFVSPESTPFSLKRKAAPSPPSPDDGFVIKSKTKTAKCLFESDGDSTNSPQLRKLNPLNLEEDVEEKTANGDSPSSFSKPTLTFSPSPSPSPPVNGVRGMNLAENNNGYITSPVTAPRGNLNRCRLNFGDTESSHVRVVKGRRKSAPGGTVKALDTPLVGGRFKRTHDGDREEFKSIKRSRYANVNPYTPVQNLNINNSTSPKNGSASFVEHPGAT